MAGLPYLVLVASEPLVLVALLVPTLVLATVIILARNARLSRLRRHYLTESEIDDLRVEVLQYVKGRTHQSEAVVSLDPFWRSYNVQEGDRLRILKPLFDSGTFLVVREDRPNTLAARIGERYDDWMVRPVATMVMLAEREYLQMIHGVSAKVVIERMTVSGNYYDNRDAIVGIQGPGAHVEHFEQNVQRSTGGHDLKILAAELENLKLMLASSATSGTDFRTVSSVAEAAEASSQGDEGAVLRYLKKAGSKALEAAGSAGLKLAEAAIRQSMGIGP